MNDVLSTTRRSMLAVKPSPYQGRSFSRLITRAEARFEVVHVALHGRRPNRN